MMLTFASCLQREEPEAPILTITPDSTVEISSVTPVTYILDGFSNEDITELKIESTPYFFEYDTLFGIFNHTVSKKIKIQISDNIAGLGTDSIITITFYLSNNYKTTEEVRLLKVVDGYPDITTGTATLYFAFDSTMFYNFDYYTEVSFFQIDDVSPDIAMLYDYKYSGAWEFIIASPDASVVEDEMYTLLYSYSAIGKRRTSISRLNTDYESIDPRALYFLSVSEEYINDNVGNGVSIAKVNVGDVFAFKLKNELKGVFRITEIDETTKKLSFEYKIQLPYSIN